MVWAWAARRYIRAGFRLLLTYLNILHPNTI
jgi:hypothetical protein